MPYGNGQGPNGMGPMTGRGAGYCAGFASAGNRGGGCGLGRGMGRGLGQGLGQGRGYGIPRGQGFGFIQQNLQTPVNANSSIIKRNLELQAEQLEAGLRTIRERITSLDSETENQSGVDQ